MTANDRSRSKTGSLSIARATCTTWAGSRASRRSARAARKSSTSSTATSTRPTSALRTASSARLRPTSSRSRERVFRMTADQVFAKAIETGDELQPDPHRRRTRSAPALARLLAAADAALQRGVAARAAFALYRGGDRVHGEPSPPLVSARSSARSRKPGSTTSTAAPPKSSARRRARRFARTRSRAANWLVIHEELHRQGVACNATMLYGHIEIARGSRRPSHSPARVAGSLARLQRVHSARVPSRRQRALVLRLDDGPRRHPHVRVARLMLDNFDHIKAYWMIQGLKSARSRCSSAPTTWTARTARPTRR